MQEQDYLWEAADSWHTQRRNEARDISDRELARTLEEESVRQENGERARQLATRSEAEEAAGHEMEAKLGIVHGSPFVDRKSERATLSLILLLPRMVVIPSQSTRFSNESHAFERGWRCIRQNSTRFMLTFTLK